MLTVLLARPHRWEVAMAGPQNLDIPAILERLPHRYPMLLIDRVVEFHPGRSLHAVKNVTYNEPFFTGHFPSRPLLPGVIVIEALAQVASLLWLMSNVPLRQPDAQLEFVGLDKARFRKPVLPGDQLLLTAHFDRSVETMMRFSTVAFVKKNQVASAEVTMRAQAPDLA